MRRAALTVMGIVMAVVAFAAMQPASAGSGDYDDPFFLNWPEFLPASATTYTVSNDVECHSGKNNCVDKVIREMTRRFNGLRCDHDSTFAFTYLLTTEEYREAVEDPNFFEDNAFINNQDAVFADFYFDQYDDFHAGRVEQVSPAWRIAFQTANDQKVSGMGNVFLGMNAHVNRDLPFVLESIGLVKPDGTSRKPDHDRVNDFLAAVNQYLLSEAAQYLDPTVDDGDIPGITLDNSVAVQALVGWREQAWRNAERLAAATTPAARDAVAQDIEFTAALEALVIRTTFRYTSLHNLLGMGKSARNSFCNSHFVSR
ncbi:DUF5995 family protein [Actinospongicola halichondriae]|uniref:DUF5995 family protein n=1 Tax=Actinospongicola halichondriae TaxID=3236844 RepID=UPI003D488172